MITLKTDRLEMRAPKLEDAGVIAGFVNDPRVYRMVAKIPPDQSVEATGHWILSVERGEAFGTDHTFLIEEQGCVIGTVGAHRRGMAEPFEIGYWIAPQAWGQGVATEAARAVIDWLDGRGQADELVSGHFVDNPASGRVLEKLGFAETGRGPVFCVGRDCEVEHIFMARRAKAG